MRKTMTINEYRRKHKRCRTCKHVGCQPFGSFDHCMAKGFQFTEPVSMTVLRGCFCKLYEPKEYKNG